MSKLFLSCHEATHVCDKTQYKESSLWERFKLHLHIIFCSFCKNHTKKNHQLTRTIKKSNIVCLDPHSKTCMKENIQKELEDMLKQ